MTSPREAQLLRAAMDAGITSPRELANFMAQVEHESNGLHRLEESFIYSKGIAQIPVQSAWRHGAVELDQARREALAGRPEHLARLMYGGRLGNDDADDGYRYRGRGYIQLTGESTYRDAGRALGVDLVEHPELAAHPDNAARIALWYWTTRVPQSAREDVRAATYAINGGYNGLGDREDRFEAWSSRITPALLQEVRQGTTRSVPAGPGASSHDPLANTLQRGEDGEAVRHLQRRLNAHGMHGLDGEAVAETGHFRGNTEAAVREFQHTHGLPATGRADAATRSALESAPVDATRAPAANPVDRAAHARDAMADGRLAYGESGNAVRELQSRLNAWGIRDAEGRPLPVTGNFRERTRAAVHAFQHLHGLDETGVADAATLAAIAKTPELRRGDGGADVVRLQRALGHAGLAVPVTGSFTYLTEGAVKEFQATHGLEPTGIVVGETRYRLDRIDTQARHEVPDAHAARHGLAPGSDDARSSARTTPASPHPLLEQARMHVDTLDRAANRIPDAGSGNLAANLAATASANGLDRIDRVVLSTDRERLIAVQGDGESRRMASVDIRDAMATPAPDSIARLDAASSRVTAPAMHEESRGMRVA